MALSIEFAVASEPQSQGSMRQVPIGRRCPSCGRPPTALTSTNDQLDHYRRDVASLASRAMRGAKPWRGPVYAELVFVVPAPQKMPPGRAGYPITTPDLDKLERAVYDACAGNLGGRRRAGAKIPGIVYRDDAQVVEHHNTKRYPIDDEPAGVIVRMRALAPELEGVQEDLAL